VEPRKRDCLYPQYLGTAIVCDWRMQACCVELVGWWLLAEGAIVPSSKNRVVTDT
jgi:hypothetical protein